MLTESLVAQEKDEEAKKYAPAFFQAWKANPFLGNGALRREIFLREIPLALSLCGTFPSSLALNLSFQVQLYVRH